MSDVKNNYKALAAAVRAEMEAHGLHGPVQVSNAGGPSAPVVTAILKGTWSNDRNPRSVTDKLDAVFSQPAGHHLAVLRGQKPPASLDQLSAEDLLERLADVVAEKLRNRAS